MSALRSPHRSTPQPESPHSHPPPDHPPLPPPSTDPSTPLGRTSLTPTPIGVIGLSGGIAVGGERGGTGTSVVVEPHPTPPAANDARGGSSTSTAGVGGSGTGSGEDEVPVQVSEVGEVPVPLPLVFALPDNVSVRISGEGDVGERGERAYGGEEGEPQGENGERSAVSEGRPSEVRWGRFWRSCISRVKKVHWFSIVRQVATFYCYLIPIVGEIIFGWSNIARLLEERPWLLIPSSLNPILSRTVFVRLRDNAVSVVSQLSEVREPPDMSDVSGVC
eukprot:GHVN01004121.1.p1 GENE.GHVN01004121.1~~GHVN01004121.1.p1  ORF type:complete len:277 (+),score=105.33 GHVN01004121.1:172-1002(+)